MHKRFADEQDPVRFELQRQGTFAQHAASDLQLLQARYEFGVAQRQRTTAELQGADVALGCRMRVDRLQPGTEPAQPAAELLGTVGQLRRRPLHMAARLVGAAEAVAQGHVAVASQVRGRSSRIGALDQPVDRQPQRAQVAPRAGRGIQHQRPAAFVQHLVDVVGQFGREALAQARRRVVVAFGQVEGDAPRTRLRAEQGLVAELSRQQHGKRDPTVAHGAASVFGTAEVLVAEQALGAQRLQHLVSEVQVLRPVAHADVLVHQGHRQLRRARAGVPDAGQHDQRIKARHQDRTEGRPGQSRVAPQQRRVDGGCLAKGYKEAIGRLQGHDMPGAEAGQKLTLSRVAAAHNPADLALPRPASQAGSAACAAVAGDSAGLPTVGDRTLSIARAERPRQRLRGTETHRQRDL